MRTFVLAVLGLACTTGLAVGLPVAPAPRPVEREVATANGDIRLVTDRAETVPEFFRRHRAMSGAILLGQIQDDLRRLHGWSLADVRAASAPVPGVTFSYPTWNTSEVSPYMDRVKVAPMSPAAAKLVQKGLAEAEKREGKVGPFCVILREDDAVPGLWHLAGYTTRTFLFDKNQALRYDPPAK